MARQQWGAGGEAVKSIAGSVTALCVVIGLQGTDTSKPPKQSDLVTVRGCLQGLRLTTPAAGSLGFGPREFLLSANRETTALLKQHTGHVEEITGLLKAGKDAGATRVKEKRGRKGRVYVGAGSRTAATESPASVATIDVRSVTHIEGYCPG
jgi:hypothetical protein